MALTLTTNFSGSEIGEIFTDVFNQSVMMNPAISNVQYNVSNAISVPVLSRTGFVSQPYTCDPITGDMTITDKLLEPKRILLSERFCKTDLDRMWMSFVRTSEQTAGSIGALEATNVEAFTNFVARTLLEQAGSEIDTIIWQSTVGNINPALAIINGLLAKMVADATVVKVGAGIPITSATVRAAFSLVNSNLNAAVKTSPKFAFYVNQNVADLYLESLSGAGFYGNQFNATAALNVMGKKVIVTNGLPDDVIVGTLTSNIITATNTDNLTLKVEELQSSDLVSLRGSYVLDSHFGLGTQVVLYKA